MKVHIQNESVRRNVDLFKQIAHRAASERKKTYSVFVNRLTGAMSFTPSVDLNEREWKPIVLHVNLDTHEIDVVEKGKENQSFECGDILPLAYKVMVETLRVLHIIVRQIHDLKELGEIEFEPSMGPMKSRDLIHEAWHQVDRLGAEKLLHGHSPGTYIFRKDVYASILENELTLAYHQPIKCVTLSYLDEDEKICDHTLVIRNERWLIYDDDPNLAGNSCETIGELLANKEDHLHTPLLHL